MEIFVSWSGKRAEQLAGILRDWLPKVIQSLRPWISASDIEKGARWLNDVSEKLNNTNFGILCLTPENLNEPWILFEAGALSKALGSSSVCPVLYDFRPSELKGPLSQFQATVIDKDDMLKLLQTINREIGEARLSENQLTEAFNLWWPKFEDEIAVIEPTKTELKERRSERDLTEEILKIVRGLERQLLPKSQSISLSSLTSRVLASLDPMEEKILRMHFGIEQNERLSTTEIAENLGVSEEQIRKTIENSLRELRISRRTKFPSEEKDA